WDLDARVAMAEKDWKGAEEKIEKAVAVLRTFEIPITAWRIHATRSDLYRHAKNGTAAEAERTRAEAIILALADSFAPDDPLRHAFLAAAQVRQILRSPKKLRQGIDPPELLTLRSLSRLEHLGQVPLLPGEGAGEVMRYPTRSVTSVAACT